MNVSLLTEGIMSETALLNPYALHYRTPFASFIISTRSPLGPSSDRLAGYMPPARDTGLPLSCLVNPFGVL
jgi:hypothetical protein